jgi:HEAT repeat protein
MLATILIIVIVAVVAGYLVRRLVVTRRNGWIEIIDAEGEHHRIPPPPYSTPAKNSTKTKLYFTTATMLELKVYFYGSLPDAGWEFVDFSSVSSGFSLVFRRGDKRLHILFESDYNFLKSKPLGNRLTYTIAVNVKASPLEEELAKIKSLGKVGNKDAFEPLMAFLDDPRPRIRQEAVKALSIIKDERSIRPLINKLTDDDTGVRQNAASALGEFDNKEAVEPLIASLNSNDDDFKTFCAYALGNLKDARAVKALVPALKSPYLRLAAHAATALGEIGDRSAIEPLTAYLKDANNNAATRVLAGRSLKKLMDPSEFSLMLESLPVQSGQDSFEAHLKDALAENVAEFATEAIFDLLGIEH